MLRGRTAPRPAPVRSGSTGVGLPSARGMHSAINKLPQATQRPRPAQAPPPPARLPGRAAPSRRPGAWCTAGHTPTPKSTAPQPPCQPSSPTGNPPFLGAEPRIAGPTNAPTRATGAPTARCRRAQRTPARPSPAGGGRRARSPRTSQCTSPPTRGPKKRQQPRQ